MIFPDNYCLREYASVVWDLIAKMVQRRAEAYVLNPYLKIAGITEMPQ